MREDPSPRRSAAIPAVAPDRSGRNLADLVLTFGQDLLNRHGQRVHKVALDTGFTCPNRDGKLGKGGCTFCNNDSFAPGAKLRENLEDQVRKGQDVVSRRTGAKLAIAYFQAYTNTYERLDVLETLWERALVLPGVVGLSIGTRPDCLPPGVLELLARLRDRGLEVWLELGLQSVFDETLRRVNRGHGAEVWYRAVRDAHALGLNVCTHLILGLPGEGREQAIASHREAVAMGCAGLKIHPLHVVRGSRMANEWKAGEIPTLSLSDYASWTADLVERTPPGVSFHRLTGTCSEDLLLAPMWCSSKWKALNALEAELRRRGTRQGHLVGTPESACSGPAFI